MMFTKYQKVEKQEIVSPEGHKVIQDGLNKTGKTSVQELTDQEKQDLLDRVTSPPSDKV